MNNEKLEVEKPTTLLGKLNNIQKAIKALLYMLRKIEFMLWLSL